MEFAVIKWKDRQLYIKEGDSTRNFKWTDDLQDAIWFPTEVDAEKTARDYFKSFTKWETREVFMDDNSLVGYLVSNKKIEPGTYDVTTIVSAWDGDNAVEKFIMDGEIIGGQKL